MMDDIIELFDCIYIMYNIVIFYINIISKSHISIKSHIMRGLETDDKYSFIIPK